MSEDTIPAGPIILWWWSGEGWSHDSYPTVKAALESTHGFTERWVICRKVDYEVVETDHFHAAPAPGTWVPEAAVPLKQMLSIFDPEDVK